MDIIEKITASQIKKDLPEFRVGDSVIVGCIITETNTVRGEYSGIGVEKTFHVHSNKVAYIKIVKPGKVRRAKLYFLRDRKSKYNIKERR